MKVINFREINFAKIEIFQGLLKTVLFFIDIPNFVISRFSSG